MIYGSTYHQSSRHPRPERLYDNPGKSSFPCVLDEFEDAISQENGRGDDADNHGQDRLKPIIEDDGVNIQGDEDVREEHIYNAPSAIDTREYVSHDERGVPKTFADEATEEEQYGADDKGFGIVFNGILPALVVTLRTNGLFIL